MLIETAAGMHHVDEIAAACPERMEAMVFGVADYAASLQSHTTSIGGSTSAYSVRTDAGAEHWGDQWHYPLARIAVACRAHGLRPIDGPYGDFGDPEGYRTAARRAAVLGYEGKWAIHPSQVALANDVFTPDAAAAEKTRRIVAAMAEAAREGRGAVSLDGRLIDAASLRMAETLLHKLEQIEAREGAGRRWWRRDERRARRAGVLAGAPAPARRRAAAARAGAARRPHAARGVRRAAARLRRGDARAVAPGAADRRLPRRPARAARRRATPAPPLVVEDVVQPSDVLCALWLARRCGLFPPGSSCGDGVGRRSACEIVPEFAPGRWPGVMEALRANAAWRAHLRGAAANFNCGIEGGADCRGAVNAGAPSRPPVRR